jgi:hypothetical protein
VHILAEVTSNGNIHTTRCFDNAVNGRAERCEHQECRALTNDSR